MCCNSKNVFKIIVATVILVVLIIFFIVIISGNSSNEKILNILVATAKNGDNTTIGTTAIKFSKNEILEGTALSHEEGSSEIKINENGIYQISYQLYGVQNVTGTFNFNAILLINNNSITNTFNESPVIRNSPSNRMTLTSTIILKLQAGNILQLQGVSIEDIEYQNARIDIEKIY